MGKLAKKKEVKQLSEENAKIKALMKHLDIDFENARELIDSGDYLVLTDDEANEKAKEYILDSAWAFRYSFLCCHSDAISEIPEKEYEEMAGKLCESFNKAVLAMIPDHEHFVEDAINSDGRGHFLSRYDGEENEITVGKEIFYIYRCN